jgi:hypothetical protein
MNETIDYGYTEVNAAPPFINRAQQFSNLKKSINHE